MEEEQAEQKEPRVYVPARRFPAACLDASVPQAPTAQVGFSGRGKT